MQTETGKQFAMEKLQIWLPFDTTFCLKLLSKMANAFKKNFFFLKCIEKSTRIPK